MALRDPLSMAMRNVEQIQPLSLLPSQAIVMGVAQYAPARKVDIPTVHLSRFQQVPEVVR